MSNINQEPPHGRNFNNLFGILHGRRYAVAETPSQPDTLPWLVNADAKALEIHRNMLEKIEALKTESLRARDAEVPLHYQLYYELSHNRGHLPQERIDENKLTLSTQERVTLVERMVPDIAKTIYNLERKGYKVLDDPIHQINASNAGQVAEPMKSVVKHAWAYEVDENGEPKKDTDGQLSSVYPLRGKLL